MSFNQDKELQDLIDQAVKKVGGQKENDICHYIPAEGEGYIHHFTMRKRKGEDPKRLAAELKKYIIDPKNPVSLEPKRRAPRGTRRNRNQVLFTKNDIDRLLDMARTQGDSDLVRKLAPRQDLSKIKRDLIASIRHNEVDEDLWASYSEAARGQTEQGQETAQHEQHTHSHA